MILGSLSLRTVAGSAVPRGSGGGYSCSWVLLALLHRYNTVQCNKMLCRLSHWGRDKMATIFADDIFKWIFSNENVWIAVTISLKFVPEGPINNIPALVQIMAWRWTGDKPLSEPILVCCTDAYMRHLPSLSYCSLELGQNINQRLNPQKTPHEGCLLWIFIRKVTITAQHF